MRENAMFHRAIVQALHLSYLGSISVQFAPDQDWELPPSPEIGIAPSTYRVSPKSQRTKKGNVGRKEGKD